MNGRGSMGKVEPTGIDGTILYLQNLKNTSETIIKEAVYEGAKILADEIKRGLVENLNSTESVSKNGNGKKKTTKPSGDLIKSFGIAPIKKMNNWEINTRIGFHGKDRKGTANQLKARSMESGTSKLKKRPFVRPAVNRCKSRVRATIDNEIRQGIKRAERKG